MYFCISLLISQLSLQVDAYPAAVTFSWFFNNSEHQEALEDERFTTSGLVSTLNFAPTTNQDYGTLFCLGENAVGHQEEPCAFKIVPTGKQPSFLRILCCCYISQRQRESLLFMLQRHIMVKITRNGKILTAFQLLYSDEYICYASNTNKLGKIGCKTRGAWKSQMTFITFCYCLLFVVRYKELRLAVARIRMVLEKESKQKSPLVNLVLLFPHGTKWTLRPTLCFWLLVLWNLVILVSMTNLTNIMI